MHTWRTAFLPKQADEARALPTPVEKARPLPIGALAYRVWAALRFEQLAPFVALRLDPVQTFDPEAAAAEWLGEEPSCCASLDFAKRFDNSDCRLALRELSIIGAPPG
eukprot:5291887-Alexandrium_andersonii.AAC.1